MLSAMYEARHLKAVIYQVYLRRNHDGKRFIAVEEYVEIDRKVLVE